jgi:hypothetical protein
MNEGTLAEPTQQFVVRRDNPDVRGTVEQTEKLMSIVPGAIVLGLVVLGTIGPLLTLHIGSVILSGVIMLIIGNLLAKLVRKVVLVPMRSMRYKKAAGLLASQVQASPEPVTVWRSWWVTFPGALAVTSHGRLVMIDQSTNYEGLWLTPASIVNVSVERQATQITNIRHGGRVTLGGVSGGLFGGYTFGGRSKAVTSTIETAFLEVRYQLERNGAVYTTVLPFGDDRRGADNMRETILRLDHRPV